MANRGISKRALYETRSDARYFLARLARQVRLGRIEVHAYCLMTTHYHLLVRSPIGQLSEAMRRVQNDHSRHFNRVHKRDGALIRGVFFSRPVRTLQYRCTLVRYIDANPVRAKIVSASGDHEFGSASAYLSATGPPWLTREWVEEEARLVARSERYTPAAYAACFGASSASDPDELGDFLDTRMASKASKDPLESLISAAPTHVQDWMQRKSKLADGHRVGLPVCGPLALGRALAQNSLEHGVWMVEEAHKTWRGEQLAQFGLMRELCSLSWQSIAALAGCPASRARRIAEVHDRLFRGDSTYAERVACVASMAIQRCLGARQGGMALCRTKLPE